MTPPPPGSTVHRLRPIRLVRPLFSMGSMGLVGLSFIGLSLAGGLGWWGFLVGGLLLLVVGVSVRPLLKDLRVRIHLDPEGVTVSGRRLLRWEEVERLSYARALVHGRKQITAITLHTAGGLELTLGSDLTDWDAIQRTLALHFGPPKEPENLATKYPRYFM